MKWIAAAATTIDPRTVSDENEEEEEQKQYVAWNVPTPQRERKGIKREEEEEEEVSSKLVQSIASCDAANLMLHVNKQEETKYPPNPSPPSSFFLCRLFSNFFYFLFYFIAPPDALYFTLL